MRFVFLGNGMTGYLKAQYDALQELGHQLMVVQPGRPELAVGAMHDTAFEHPESGESMRYVGWQREPRGDELAAEVLAFDPDAVVMTSWNFCAAYRTVMRRVAPGVVRILVMDNLWRAAPKQWLGRLTHRWYVDPVADAVMVPSDRTEFYARRLGFGPGDVIRGSLSADTGLFCSAPREGAELASRRSFLYVGRLVEHKGADVLAEAYARYRERVDGPWDLHVVGMGPLQRSLEAVPGVRLHGFRQPAEVAQLMREVSCCVVPSRIEPYGVVVHEATASALPILCADFVGAAPGLVQDGGNGWIVPSGDVSAWAEALVRMGSLGPARLAEMSETSRAMSRRLSPQTWAVNLAEQVERRRGRGRGGGASGAGASGGSVAGGPFDGLRDRTSEGPGGGRRRR